MFRRAKSQEREPVDSNDDLRAPLACVKCQALFVPMGTGENETQCFTCSPRNAFAVPDAPPAAAKSRRTSRRRFSMDREEGIKNMQHGGVVLVIGSTITFVTYAFADSTHGFFVIAWGSILFGGIRLLQGITQYFS
jgi:hypothetical protein